MHIFTTDGNISSPITVYQQIAENSESKMTSFNKPAYFVMH